MPTRPGTRRQLMAPGQYTELFFLDEPTALAAGHRPCAQCRPSAFVAFAVAWARATGLAIRPSATTIDAALAGERGERSLVRPADLPEGAMAAEPDADVCWLIDGGGMRRWSFGGYGSSRALPPTPMVALTPPSIIAVLRAGYVPLTARAPFGVTATAASAARSGDR